MSGAGLGLGRTAVAGYFLDLLELAELGPLPGPVRKTVDRRPVGIGPVGDGEPGTDKA
jgi:hypothetical protein